MNERSSDTIRRDAERSSVSDTVGGSSLTDDQMEKIELLLADLGQMSEIRSSIKDFADEAKHEVKWNRIARLGGLLGVGILLALLVRLIWLIVVDARFSTLRDSASALSIVLAGAIGGGVILTGTTIRALFSSFAERNAELPMPNHLSTIYAAMQSMISPNR